MKKTKTKPKSLKPAAVVYKTFGGVRATAKAIRRDASSVCRWGRPVAKKGNAGRVPERLHERIIKAAKRIKKRITYRDLTEGRTL